MRLDQVYRSLVVKCLSQNNNHESSAVQAVNCTRWLHRVLAKNIHLAQLWEGKGKLNLWFSDSRQGVGANLALNGGQRSCGLGRAGTDGFVYVSGSREAPFTTTAGRLLAASPHVVVKSGLNIHRIAGHTFRTGESPCGDETRAESDHRQRPRGYLGSLAPLRTHLCAANANREGG